MKFTLAIAMTPLDQLVELARTAEECGYSSIALPDSLFYSEKVSAAYPYTPDGTRFWDEDTPWVDPLIAAASMATATSRIRFYTQVLKLNPRNPLLLARQVASVAVLTANRFALGVGLGWSPEETHWCGGNFTHRGAQADEAIEIIRRALTGEMTEYHGKFYNFDRLKIAPPPTLPVPIYIGGHTAPALKRAAQAGDGWTSAMIRYEDLKEIMKRLKSLRAEHNRTHVPFEIQAVCIDRFGLEGYRAQASLGVTDAIVMPWMYYGKPPNCPLREKQDALKRFAEEIIEKL